MTAVMNRNHTLPCLVRIGYSFLGLLLGASSVFASASRTAGDCRGNLDQTPQKILADHEGSGSWHQYGKATDIPPLYNGSAAFVWPGAGGKLFLALQDWSEGSHSYTDYCSDPSGKLWRLRHELRTVWGWRVRTEGSTIDRKLRAESSKFFETGKDQMIPRAEMADDMPDALRPTLYFSKTRLPFYKFLIGAKIPNGLRNTNHESPAA